MTHPAPVSAASRDALFPTLEDVHVALVVHGAQGQAVLHNRRAAELLGLTAAELLGTEPLPAGWELLAEDGTRLPDAEHPARRAAATGADVSDLVVGIRRPRQGDVAWAQVNASLRSSEGGRQVVVTWVDITERVRAQQALKDSETRYRTLFDSMDAAVLLMDGPACVDCNPATAKLFGVPDAKLLIGKTPLDYAPEFQPNGRRSADVVQENILLSLQNHGRTFEWHTTKADGTPILLEVLFTPFALGGGNLFQCIARDVTERKRAEQLLRESEGRFRAITEQAAEGILLADAATRRFRYANPEICRMLGYGADELTALHVEDIHPPEEVPGLLERFGRAVRLEVQEVQTQCRRKDGTLFEATIRAVPLVLGGEPCLVGFFRDDTVQRQLEDERLKAQKLEAIGILAGGIAHDFNNLLQGVFGFLSLAKQVNDDREKSRALLEQSEQALQTAVGLTNQLLTFSRGGRPVKKLLAVAPTVESAVRLALSGSSTICDCDLPAELWPVEADAGQLAQVFQNIALNAAQAMPQGGTLTGVARNVVASGHDLPRQLAPGRYVAISMSDTGVGIRPADLPRVFDPYFTTRARGSGLGLATAWSIVKAHGGLIDVQSTPGSGSTFTVYLPAAATAAAPAPSPAAPEGVRPLRVLLMDDEPMIRTVSERLLHAMGHEVALAEHGDRALELFELARASGRPFDVVILDLTVRGGLGGLETMARLRALAPGVKVIVSSGYSDDEAVAEYRTHGFTAVLNKPYTWDQLARVLREVLA